MKLVGQQKEDNFDRSLSFFIINIYLRCYRLPFLCHCVLSLSLSFFPTSLSLSLSHTHTHTHIYIYICIYIYILKQPNIVMYPLHFVYCG